MSKFVKDGLTALSFFGTVSVTISHANAETDLPACYGDTLDVLMPIHEDTATVYMGGRVITTAEHGPVTEFLGSLRTDSIADVPTFDNVGAIGSWFMVGADFSGTTVVTDSQFTATTSLPEPDDGDQGAGAGSNQTHFSTSPGGAGTVVSYSGFGAGTSVLQLGMMLIDPNAPRQASACGKRAVT